MQYRLRRADFRPWLSRNLISQDLLKPDHKRLQLLAITRPAVDCPANLTDFFIITIDATVHFPHVAPHRLELIEAVGRRQPPPITTTVFIRGRFGKLKKRIHAIKKTPGKVIGLTVTQGSGRSPGRAPVASPNRPI